MNAPVNLIEWLVFLSEKLFGLEVLFVIAFRITVALDPGASGHVQPFIR